MGEIDERPQEVGEIVLELRIGGHRGEGIEYRGELRLGEVGLRQRPRVGVVGAGAVAEEREFVEKIGGWGRSVLLAVAIGSGTRGVAGGHRGCLLSAGWPRRPRPSRAIPGRRRAPACTRGWPAPRAAKRRSVAEDAGRAAILSRAAKPPRLPDRARVMAWRAAAGNSCPDGIAGRCRLRQIARSGSLWRGASRRKGARPARTRSAPTSGRGLRRGPTIAIGRGRNEAHPIGRDELMGQALQECCRAERRQVDVESPWTGTRSRISMPAAAPRS